MLDTILYEKIDCSPGQTVAEAPVWYISFPVNVFEVPSTNTIIEVCSSRYQKICKEYNNSNTDKIINSHFGEFSQDLVNTISNDVEMFMLDSGDKKGTVNRMFSILVEGLQNIRLHGEKGTDDDQYTHDTHPASY